MREQHVCIQKDPIMKRRLILAPALVFLTSGILLLGCSKDGGDDGYSGGGNNNNNPPPSSGNKVSISSSSFSPGTLTVNKGTTVTWTNADYDPHTVTADDNSFTSTTLNTGDSYSRTFSTAGTFPYHCNFHTNMTASVVVKE